MDNQHLGGFETALEAWTDERFVSRDQVRALAMFSMYIVNLADDGGWSYYGHSYKVGTPLGCLVMKATIDDRSVVSFTSARTFCGCVRIFIRKCEMGVVEWRPDRYRQ